MKLKKFIENLNEFVKENPDALDLEVVTSKDAEGNGYSSVHYTPSKGFYDGTDFISTEQYEELEMDDSETNAVCIN